MPKVLSVPVDIRSDSDGPTKLGCVLLRRNSLLLTLAIVCALAIRVFGQATLGSATIGGTVTDTTGSSVPQATVVLTDLARGSTKHALTNDAGSYLFPNVPTGQYQIDVSKSGFDSKRVTGIDLRVGEFATVDAQLPVGAISTVVSVSGEQSTILDTESNVIGTVVNSTQVQELPLNGRDFLQLALTAAGSSPVTGGSDVYSSQIGHPDRAVVIDGNPPTTTGYTINGIATRGERLGESALNLSIAAIDQFKVQESFFMPDQGPDPALVNVTTKGGANQIHGQAFDFLRNSSLDARSFFAPAPEELKRNQFGFAVGGPVIHDKVWYYGYYEGLRQTSAFSARAYTPTQAMFGGNFQSVASTIYDPASYSQATGTRTPFPSNVIPQDRLNPVSLALLKYYLPGATLTEYPSNLFVNPNDTLDDDQGGLRIDALLTSNQMMFAQVLHESGNAVNAGIFPVSGASYPNSSTLAMVQHTWTLSPTLVNTARIGFTRDEALFTNQGVSVGHILEGIGITNTLDDRGVTAVSLQGYSGFGRANGNLGNIDNNYQADDGMNWVHGSHNVQFGASVRYRRTWEQNANAGALGSLQFQPDFTAQLGLNAKGAMAPVAGTGSSFADFLLGLPFNASLAGLPMFQYRSTQFLPYFEDTWRITPRLTLNYGISWDLTTVPNPQGTARQYVHGFDFQTGLLTYAALNQVSPQVLSLQTHNFTPRLGLAWQPSFLPNTVIRAGAGMYFDDEALSEAQFAMVGPPFNTPLQLFNTGLTPQYILGQNVFPVSSFPALSKNFAASLPNGTTSFLLNGPGPIPYVDQWNLSIEHSITPNDSIELDYLGSSSHDLQNRYDSDQCVPTAALYCSPTTKPYPRYAGLLTADFNGNSSYEAFFAKYYHRITQGLDFRLEYALSKVLTDAFEGPNVATSTQIADCRRCDKGYASFDQFQRAVASTVYEVPFGRGRRFGAHLPTAVNLLAGDWVVTAIGTFASGLPIFITSPSTTASIYIAERPNRVCNGADSALSGNLRTDGFLDFNTACFVAPGAGYFGNSGRAPLFGPGINNWDIGIQKQFPVPITEAALVEFRAEMFNAFNHAQFLNPNANTGAGPNFGRVSATAPPRLVQLALKLDW